MKKYCIILFFYFLGFNILWAMESTCGDNETYISSFVFRENIYKCVRIEKTKISICRNGSNYYGFLYLKKNKEFIPFLFDHKLSPLIDINKFNMQEKIKGIVTVEPSTGLKTIAKPKLFFQRDFIYQNPAKITIALSSAIHNYDGELGDIIDSWNSFLPQYRMFLRKIKNSRIGQNVVIDDGIIYSYFSFGNSGNNNFLINQKTKEKIPVSIKVNKKQTYEEISLPSDRFQPVTLEKSQEIFKKIMDTKKGWFIYSEDDCYARAHLVNHVLNLFGVKTGKIWLSQKDLKNPNPPYKPWRYHVAAIIFVTIDGKEKIRIVEPAFNSERLLTKKEWFKFLKSNSPAKINYPLPIKPFAFRDAVYCISSHIPYYPKQYGNELYEETLAKAAEIIRLRQKMAISPATREN